MAGVPTFATGPGFLGRRITGIGPSFTVAGIPLDIGVTNRAGARSGPAAIRQASRMLVDGDHPHFWTDVGGMAIADMGEFEIMLGDLPGSLALIEQQARPIPHLIAMGGEHGVTLPLLRALRKRLGEPLALVHFDAHADTWDESFGQVYGHGSVFYHAINEGLVDPRRMIQIGIRSPIQRGIWDWTIERGVRIITAQEVHEIGPAEVAARIRGVVGRDAPAYLTFDIDCLDPAFAPGTGTPEIGGLASWQTQAVLRRLVDVSFVGMDVVEVLPAHDVSEITALAAATVIWEYLALLGRPES
ncbi:MAG: agmatinase [Proteobacteria bacterium]|nr:agmatinase [Pseudomonadota bacterium]